MSNKGILGSLVRAVQDENFLCSTAPTWQASPQRIDRLKPLAAGSREEVEIRAATVWAGELMRQAIAPRFPQVMRHSEVTALHIDYWLWEAGQVQGPDVRPYHRTRSIYY